MKKLVTMLVLAIVMMAGVSYGQTVTNDASLKAAVINFASDRAIVNANTDQKVKQEIIKAMIPKIIVCISRPQKFIRLF